MRGFGQRPKVAQTMLFATTEERETTMQHRVGAGAKSGCPWIGEVLRQLEVLHDG